jgi:GH15 family glucan-1,4-alpha-glucosidase
VRDGDTNAGRHRSRGDLQAIADEIKADILAHGVDKRGVLRQHYDTDALDASTLLAAIFGFLPPTTSGCAPACSPSPTS